MFAIVVIALVAFALWVYVVSTIITAIVPKAWLEEEDPSEDIKFSDTAAIVDKILREHDNG